MSNACLITRKKRKINTFIKKYFSQLAVVLVVPGVSTVSGIM